ncbi:ECF transporter S component [Secundilactobacillus paracollinoides]|uniref:ECF transporter S component n=1 Tax=Secundilactobacillus paracollinoides TaxID=240427 RepID=A0A1B2J213_9LACO|nr:ECF transporter S component [Secundilactobacillus paracollinoides]ANZ62362.1 hypothetical protein AYR61_14160 [Secundilactobacillus paracollinoides]ANZ68313.1 hypothetical protein AYR63_15060 [Secundilactobacillus paracollinoides]
MKTRSNAYRISLLALFIAIVIIQTLVPFLGYIPVGPFSIVTIQATTVIASVTMGTREGAIVGLVWGLTDWIRAFVWPTSPLAVYVLVNPLVSVVPRVLVGLVAGWLFFWLARKGAKTWHLALTGVVGALINTIFVLGFMALLYQFHMLPMAKLHIAKLMPWLLGIMATNGIPEAIMSGILVPVIGLPLRHLMSRVSK